MKYSTNKMIFFSLCLICVAMAVVTMRYNTQRQPASQTITESSTVLSSPVPSQQPTHMPVLSSPVPSQQPTHMPVPTGPKPSPIIQDEILKLREEYGNNDIIGYIEIEGTNISYPVLQYADNDYYLNRNIYGEYDDDGAIFMDYENSPEYFMDNTVIYGHNMRGGAMFHNMRYYKDESFFKQHPSIKLTTLYEQTQWDIFAFYETTTDFYYIQVSYENRADFEALLNEMLARAAYDTGVTVSSDDKILTLSTCANQGGDYRYVLNAKLAES